MDSEIVLRRIQELELEVQKLKAQVARGGGRRVQVVVKKSVGFVLTYWTLLSFFVAIGIAFYIKYAFKVDYFESYRTLAASREMAGFHNKLGNDLLRRQEWAAAEEAFTRALAADSNHPDASYGLIKSRIFKPASGEEFTSPRTQDTMIAFLREQRPQDADLDMLQALRHWEQNQKAEARNCALAAIEKQPDFSAVQDILGYMALVDGDIAAAKSWMQKAIDSDPGNANALTNLGFMHLLTGELDAAREKLERANFAEPRLLNVLLLADTHRLKGELTDALNYSRHAVKSLENEKLRASPMMGGEWYLNYLPEGKEDKASWKSGIYAATVDRKEAFARFSLALDLVLTGEVAAAEPLWARVMELAPGEEVQNYFVNKIKAAVTWLPEPIPEESKKWLQSKFNAE